MPARDNRSGGPSFSLSIHQLHQLQGPRFSIVEDIPYDRSATSMRAFDLCAECAAEYHHPADRRFHAQPTACPRCGPWLSFLTNSSGNWEQKNVSAELSGQRAMQAAAEMINESAVIAIKGIGGYHLACNAQDAAALVKLRSRKLRSDKPFALMARDMDAIKKQVILCPEEAALLRCAAAPIVLLKKRADCLLPEQIAPRQEALGMMLPYTPLHPLLFNYLQTDLLVMTSANLSEEPLIFRDNPTDIKHLFSLCDGILTHNRPIVTRMDDSVLRWSPIARQPLVIRRARGYAPQPIISNGTLSPPLLAVGAHLKNTFCLAREGSLILSHHIGDMENYETENAFQNTVDHYEKIFRFHPHALACDLHPDYATTRYAERRAAQTNLPLLRIQHHYAHIASVMAEHQRFSQSPLIGLAFDGTGYGDDGTIWGGEILACNCDGFERLCHLRTFPLPGGDQAIRQPALQALALLWSLGIDWTDDIPAVRFLNTQHPQRLRILRYQLENKVQTSETSSMGRLFDAVSALIGVCQEITYEGQAAIELENIASGDPAQPYHFETNGEMINSEPLIHAILSDFRAGVAPAAISGRFHQALIHLALEICIRIREGQLRCRNPRFQPSVGAFPPIVLSGGVWQNRILFEGTYSLLRENGFEVLVPQKIPLNDGCIAIGQAVIAGALLKE